MLDLQDVINVPVWQIAVLIAQVVIMESVKTQMHMNVQMDLNSSVMEEIAQVVFGVIM